MGQVLPIEKEGKAEVQIRFVELRAKGLPLRAIAKELKVSTGTLCDWGAKLEEEIASLKAIELESLYEEFFLLKESRIKSLGGQLKAIQDELSARDLSDVPTEKLLDLSLRFRDALDREYVQPRPISTAEIQTMKALKQDGSVTDLNAADLEKELVSLLLRLRAGTVGKKDAARELSILAGIGKAKEISDLEKKLDRLASVLEDR